MAGMGPEESKSMVGILKKLKKKLNQKLNRRRKTSRGWALASKEV